ncbi:MAG: hypothetical protein LUD50_04390, partial [Clostridia bacterium]|nr:hypothetical protein [Clostridia bacterium]
KGSIRAEGGVRPVSWGLGGLKTQDVEAVLGWNLRGENLLRKGRNLHIKWLNLIDKSGCILYNVKACVEKCVWVEA